MKREKILNKLQRRIKIDKREGVKKTIVILFILKDIKIIIKS
jgi:hypothetical protein